MKKIRDAETIFNVIKKINIPYNNKYKYQLLIDKKGSEFLIISEKMF